MPRSRLVLADAQNDAPKPTSNGTQKRVREANSIDTEDVGPAPKKKVNTGVGKFFYKSNLQCTHCWTSRLVAKKTSAKKVEPRTATRRSARAQAVVPTAPPKRKRRTKAEIAADKAKADAEKKKLEDAAKENQLAMKQMDMTRTTRAEAAARTIKNLGDLDDDSGEEFIGYANVKTSESESESDGEVDNAALLKVRFPSCVNR